MKQSERGNQEQSFIRRVESAAQDITAWVSPPHKVLLVSTEGGIGRVLLEALNSNPQVLLDVIYPDGIVAEDQLPYDVVVACLSDTDLEPLSWSLRMRERLGYPECVFVTRDASGAISVGLSELGFQLLLPLDAAAVWLPKEIPTLTRMARSRRVFEEARGQLHVIRRPPSFDTSSSNQGLFAAECLFRETYIRGLLALTGSRREAAEQARVSYRTLCHIMSKLGLSSGGRQSDMPPAPTEMAVKAAQGE